MKMHPYTFSIISLFFKFTMFQINSLKKIWLIIAHSRFFHLVTVKSIFFEMPQKSSKILYILVCFLLQGCQESLNSGKISTQESSFPVERRDKQSQNTGKIFGDISLFKSNAHPVILEELWYGALESMKAFPISLTDAEHGIIQTCWINLVGYPKDRYQIRITIFPSKTIQANAVIVSVIHENHMHKHWQLGQRCQTLECKIKEIILLKARQYKISKKNL